jgi:putative flippase GtrA
MGRTAVRPPALQRLLADQRVTYLLVGGLNTALGLGVFVLLYLVGLPYLVALALAYALVLPVGFALQRRFVFKVTGTVVADFLRYCTVQSAAFAMNVVFLPALVEVLGAPVVPAQVVSLALVVVGSYLLHRSFTFKRA